MAHGGLHRELTRFVETNAGVKFSPDARSYLHAYFSEVLSHDPKTITPKTIRDKIRDAAELVRQRWPGLKKSGKASVLQFAINYAAVIGFAVLLHKAGVDPKYLLMKPLHAGLVNAGLTTAMFLAEYYAVRRQMEKGETPASPEVAVPIAAVFSGKKGAKKMSWLAGGIDAAKIASQGGGGLNPVWNNIPGLGVRLTMALLNYSFPGWSHRVVERLDSLRQKQEKPK